MENKGWNVLYQNRQQKVEEAISCIQSNQKVFLATFCNEPQTLVEELVRQKDRLHNARCLQGYYWESLPLWGSKLL